MKKLQKKTNNTSISDGIKTSNEMQQLVNEKVFYIQEIIKNTILSIHTYKSYDIILFSDVSVCINTLYELQLKTNNILKQNENCANIDTVIDALQQVIDKLSNIISTFGTKHIDDLLYICFGNEYKKQEYMDPIINHKYNLIKTYAHPVSYKIITWKSQRKPRGMSSELSVNQYCTNKISDDILIIENANHLECFDIETTTRSFYYKVYGSRIIFQNEKLQKTLVVHCIFDDIPLDFFCNKYISYRKEQILNHTPTNFPFDENISMRIIDSMSLKDILIYGNNDMYKKQLMIHTDVQSIRQHKIDVTIKKFLEMEAYLKRAMLTNLLIYNKEDDIHYIAYLLYDLLGVSANSNNTDTHLQKLLYDSLSWKIKSYFKDTMNITVKYTQDMISKYDISSISLEQQIYLLKVPDNVREKAMLKLKEIKSKAEDTSNKARQYLEGLLKIPFGIYREENLLKCVKDLNIMFSNVLKKSSIIKNIPYTFENKNSYSIVEINKYIKNIEPLVLNNVYEKSILFVKTASSKQLADIISSINFMCKNGDLTIKPVYENELKVKNKTTRVNAILNIINDTRQHGNTTKLYELLYSYWNTGVTPILIPNDIRTIKHSLTDINLSLQGITDVLDTSIYGHTHAKNQILKIVAQWMTGEKSGYCFGFEGSPGIGKTSLAKYGLANCLKDTDGCSRPFSFIALGGSCNGSTLEGHSYTYVNSNWGRIVDILMESKCMNPIIYIDELDKVSKTEQGKEIFGILTHLIDTTQNDGFQDKYFSGINIDLSKVLFIFSYNDPAQIDKILLDRIHRIKFDNLSLNDKLVVVEKHLLPEINKKMGFSNVVTLNPDVLEYIINTYTLEPGVRKLKEVLFDLYGEINVELLTQSVDNDNINIPIVVSIDDLGKKYLNKYRKIEERVIHLSPKVGVINGLWANTLGKGGILPIEAVFYPTQTFLEMHLTGLQGDVMKESMNVAKTLAWSLTPEDTQKQLTEYFEKTKCQGLHVHCPEGSISKDGPSAGAAITITLYSLFNNIPIKNNVAITGEISLQGNITAIGGLESKVLGGIRAGVKTFIYPIANHKDMVDIQNKYQHMHILDDITFIEVEYICDIYEYVF
jgi:ATP-dependent Lon protease